MAFTEEDRGKARRGTALSIVGGVVLACFKLLGFVLRAIFGGPAFGLYAIAYSIIELLAFFIVGGFNDTIVVFASRLVEAEQDPDVSRERVEGHYHQLATLIFFPFFIALTMTLGIQVGVDWIYVTVWAQHDVAIVEILTRLSWCLPLFVLMQVPLEATKAHLEWRWPVIVVQILFPSLSLLATLVLHYAFGQGIQALVDGALLALVVCVPLALVGYAKHFSLTRTLRGLARGPFEREALGFALPQSLNMMLNQGLVRVDSVMLSAFVSSNAVGIYSLVSELTQAIRLAKMSVSGVFSPIVARYHSAQNKAGIQDALRSFVRVTSAYSVPLLLFVLATYEVWILDSTEVWTESRWFPWLLCVGPMMSCFFGLAGNTLLMMGHPRLLLANACVTGLLNLLLNWLFIPEWGLLGAALATSISNASISCLQIVELRWIRGLGFRLGFYQRTLISACLPLLLIVWSQQLAFVDWYLDFEMTNAMARVGVGLTAVAMYLGLQWGLPGANPLRGFLTSADSEALTE